MKLSTRGRYGLRLMLDLALHHGEGPVLLKDISRRQGISEKYLGNLIHPLKTMGLVNSYRGAHGGYMLAKAPAEVTLKDIMRILEGSMCLVACVDDPVSCERAPGCIAREIWSEATRNIARTFESMTLETMVKRHRKKEKSMALSKAKPTEQK